VSTFERSESSVKTFTTELNENDRENRNEERDILL